MLSSFLAYSASEADDVSLRSPTEIMHPKAMSAFKASRLSFQRQMIRSIVAEKWRFERNHWELDSEGRGLAIYRIERQPQPLYFVIYSHKLRPEERTDRIIANIYEGEGFLCVGAPSAELIALHRTQFADFLRGRSAHNVIGWSRVNRSGRIFDKVVDALAEGHQPDVDLIDAAGYLVRNNGFWGNGRHGTATFRAYPNDKWLCTPYFGDLLPLYLWRLFSCDLVEHIAACRNPEAAVLHPQLRRFIGVGNASGLGMVPYVIRHPHRIHKWIKLRETAIGRIKAQPATAETQTALLNLIERACHYYATGVQVQNGIFMGSQQLAAELGRLQHHLAQQLPSAELWADLCRWTAERLDLETLELLHSLLIEAYPHITDPIAAQMLTAAPATADIKPQLTVEDLRDLIEANYAWALDIDMSHPSAHKHFWYLSQDNLEPRHGERGVDPGEAYETFVDIIRPIQELYLDLQQSTAATTIAAFLFAYPNHRATVERAFTTDGLTYGEVHGNIIDADFDPCHLIRFLLAMYGMEKTDPQSRLWVRGTFLQGAPTPDQVAAGIEGDWIFPTKPAL